MNMNMNVDAMMSKAVDKGMRTMLRAYGEMLVSELSVKYEFSAEEGMRYLEGSKMEMGKGKSKESKESKEKKVKEKEIPLPYMGVVKEEWCGGMRKTHGLYNQCRNEKVGGGEGNEYCGRCEKESKITGTGEPRGGRIEDRGKVDEKKITHYSVVMKKLGLRKEEVENEAAKYGWVVDESEFEKPKSKRGRKKNENETENENEKENEGKEGKEKEKKQRGRPKKDKTVVSCDGEGVDLIAEMVKEAEAAKVGEESEEEVEEEEVEDEEAKEAKKQADKEAKKEAKKEADEKVYVGEFALKEKFQPKGSREEEEEEEGEELESEEMVEEEEEMVEEGEEEESEEIEVEKFEFEGKTYCKTKDNVVYDPETSEEVGMWNEEEEKLEYFEEEEEE